MQSDSINNPSHIAISAINQIPKAPPTFGTKPDLQEETK